MKHIKAELTPWRRASMKAGMFVSVLMWGFVAGICVAGLLIDVRILFLLPFFILIAGFCTFRVFNAESYRMTIDGNNIRMNKSPCGWTSLGISLNAGASSELWLKSMEYPIHENSPYKRQYGILVANYPIGEDYENDIIYYDRNAILIVYSENFLKALTENFRCTVVGELKEEKIYV